MQDDDDDDDIDGDDDDVRSQFLQFVKITCYSVKMTTNKSHDCIPIQWHQERYVKFDNAYNCFQLYICQQSLDITFLNCSKCSHLGLEFTHWRQDPKIHVHELGSMVKVC